MAAPVEANHGGLHDDEDGFEDTEDSDMDEYEDDEPAPAPPAAAVSPNPNPNGLITIQFQALSSMAGPSEPQRQRIEEKRPAPMAGPAAPAPAPSDDSRKLFQRLWTDDDEIKILKGFFEFTSSRGTTFASHQYDTGPFYEQIKHQLPLEFTKSQLLEKLRRLKKKYRNTASRMAAHGSEFSFKNPHEKATYEIARNIWSAGVNCSRGSDDDELNHSGSSDRRHISGTKRRGRKRSLEAIQMAMAPVQLPMLPAPPPLLPPAVAVASEGMVMVEVQTAPAPIIPPMPSASPAAPPLMPSASPAAPPLMPSASPAAPPVPPTASIDEEALKSCLSPIFKELLNAAANRSPGFNGGLGYGLMELGPPLLCLGWNSEHSATVAGEEKWKQQQILELEVYLKRVELVRDQIKSALEKLKSPVPVAAAPTGGR